MKRFLGFCLALVALCMIGLFLFGCSNGGSKVDPGDLDLVEAEDGDTETEADSEEADADSDLACKEEVSYPPVLEFGAVMSGGANTMTVTVYASPSHLIKRALIVNDDATPQEFSFITSTALPCADTSAETCHRIEIGKAANSVEPLQFAILYTPKDGALPDTAELEIETDDPCVPTKRIPLSSSCKGVYALAVTVDGQAVSATNPLTFGPVMPANPVNPSTPKVIKLSNTGAEGNNASVFVSLTVDNTFSDNFTFSDCNLTDLTKGFVLGIGESKSCSLFFKGRATPGDYTSRVSVNWNSSCSAASGAATSPVSLPLTGSVAECVMVVEPNPKLDFGPAVINKDVVHDRFTIVNTCPFKINWSGCELTTNTQFSVECPVGGELLAEGTVASLSASFAPTLVDYQLDTLALTFSREDDSGTQIIKRTLVGRGTPCSTPTCCPAGSDGCQPGLTRCTADNGVEICNTACSWIAGAACATGWNCNAGVCVPPCVNGQTMCAGTSILECGSNAWASKQDCNDNNPCTTDSCSQLAGKATCSSTKVIDGTACDDGLSETSGTVCTNGVCGLPACVNDNVCCVNNQPTNENGACPDDNNPCTEDACKAGVCTHSNSANTKECRPVAGSCDVPELCDGQGHCPEDQFKPDTERCGLSNGSVCDIDDYCTGFGAECINQKSTDICRAPADDCDYVEMCDGTHDICPLDRTMDDASPCGADKKNQCLAGHCVDCVDDSGCADLADDGNECTAPACNTSTHTCYQKPLAVGHACGDATVTVCDRADTCNEAGVCQVNHEPSTKLCRASDGECDVAESCDGQGKCADDGFKPNTTPCRSSNGPCDLAESCTGTSAQCPADSKSTASCREAAGDCDLAATCDGTHDTCPENAKKTDGTSCGQDGSDQCVGGNCVDCLDDSGCQDLAWGLRDEACSKRSCGSNHLCTFSDNADGTTCGAGGKDQCLGGACKDCVDVSGCAEIALGTRDDECASKACEGNYCVFATQPAGTACSMLGTGTGDQCDDAGVCQDCVDLVGCADLPDDQNSCTDKACVQNVCQNQNDNTNGCSLNTGCTTDACQDGACEPQTVSSGCFIDGICVGSGAKKSLTGDDSCKVCDHASPNGWKTLTAGESCDDGNSESRNDKCGSDGKCEGVICMPNCTGKECGDDGCGGNCGMCQDGWICKSGICSSSCSTGSQCFPIPPTNQTNCYNVSGAITCPSVAGSELCGSTAYCGQDAQYLDNDRTFTCYNSSGAAVSCASIPVASEGETVKDSVTKLIWQRIFITPDLIFADPSAYLTYCDSLEYGGYSDWRLPTAHEYASLLDFGDHNSSLVEKAFPGIMSDYAFIGRDYSNWMYSDYLRVYYNSPETWKNEIVSVSGLNDNHRRVRCVRGGSIASDATDDRYTSSRILNDQIVFDNQTKLYWKKTISQSLTWQASLSICQNSEHAGYRDWRLPNINELYSLVTYKNDSNLIMTDFPDLQGGYYFSSTSYEAIFFRGVLVVNFVQGTISAHRNGSDSELLYANSICVRGGPSCVPACNERECGSDGCGGSCGTCNDGLSCNSEGQCTQAGLTWKSIPSGTFMMGCSESDTRCLTNENPRHTVNVSAFEMLETEVTQAQYQDMVGANPSYFQPPSIPQPCPTCPVEQVNWMQATAFCKSIGGRLPTEAEWEYAARSGTTTVHYCGGDSCVDSIAWFGDNSGGTTHPVKFKQPNAFALYDMEGNVGELLQDCWHNSYTGAPTDSNAWIGSSCTEHSLRAGSYSSDFISLRTSARGATTQDYTHRANGFRCARDLPIVNDCTGQAAHTRCNDNNPCTDNDECDGSGSCTGIANGWCWFDPSTKLVWQNPPGGLGQNENNGGITQRYCWDLSLSGHNGWDVPTISQLRSLIRGCPNSITGGPCEKTDDCRSYWCHDSCYPCSANQGPANGCYWPAGLNGTCGRYWSSIQDLYSVQTKWIVDFQNADLNIWPMGNNSYIRCVQTCVPSCNGMSCGPDNCGGTCGTCLSNETCNASGQCEATTPPEPAHDIILKDTAIVVPEEVAATVDTPTCGTMRFPFENGQPPFTVVPGNTIVSGLGTGFLCRVLTATTQGSELVLTTEAGTLSDVIESGTLQFKVPLAIADAPGKRKNLTASLTLPSRKLYDNHGLTVTLRPGSLTFQPDLNVRADYGLIEGPYFLATVSGTLSADAGIDMELGATASIDGQVTVFEKSFPFYFQAGPLPVAGRVIVSVKPGFSASASGTLSSSYGARSTRTVTAGAEYSEHQWRSVNVTNQSTVERYGPNVDASVGLQAEVKVDVQSELLLYETASANILVAPRVEGDLTPHANWSYDWDLNACVWGGIGADIEIFHHALVSYDKTLFNRCWDLWNGSGCINQCATKNLYCSTPGTVAGCGEMDDGDNCLDTYYKECAANQTCKNGSCVGECTSGACCNTTTQSYKAAGAVCKTDYQYICKLGSACGGTVTRQKQTQTCTGTSADCKGPVSSWTDDSTITCTSDQKCLAGQSSCAPCTTDGCTSGPCCDTASTPKTVRSSSYVCEPNSTYEYSCPDGTGAGSDVYIRFRDRYCPGGQETSCTGSLGALKTEEVFAYCGNSEHCNAATGTCDPNGCTSSNWCQTNNHGSGSYCSASNTVTTCRTSNGCFEVANTTTCSTGQGCSNGSCTDSCSSICSGYCGTYLGCNCGSCSSGEVCGPDHLCYDCAGARKCDVFINSTEAEIFRGNTESNTVGACTTISTPGWHNGPTVNNINLRWTWVTGCTPPPDGGNLTNYAGDNARYNFYVPVEGYYTIKVKIPAVGYLCANQQNTRHADDVYYGLIRPLEQGRVFGPFATSQFKGQWMPLTATPLHLYAGDQTLILYDRGSTGSGCIGTGSRWVFVDSVKVEWDH